ncbi:MAG: type I DNA topoisomerase [Rikenellaceae bacterium]|nr:type I DNA topoisomerase [Rikenellaceae bacterium]
MADNLVIVESPAKAKTIEKFLGDDYTVASSKGHIRDLPKKGLGVDIDDDFKPTYEISGDKGTIVSQLRSLAKKAKTVWLASDEDREGEAIAWHLSEALGLDAATTKRIVFHEITKSAILKAIENPRTVDMNLVDAQQARRILDRLVGFELSPLLWRKVKPSLSAGRVQSVAVRLIVEREREIIDFKGSDYFKVTAMFLFTDDKGRGYKVRAELPDRFDTEEEAKAFLNVCSKAQFKVGSVETKPGRRSPAAPFTTSTLQQEASRKLGFSVLQTMALAQRLYEAGLITYMRTDSVNLSVEAQAAIKEAVVADFGKEYHKARSYKTKSKGAQEAHEAIRPSYIDRREISGTTQEKRLYELIWKRAVASQMADAVMERTTADIEVGGSDKRFVAKGEVVRFDGYLRLYQESTDSDDDGGEHGALLPPISTGDVLTYDAIEAVQRPRQRPARYSEASLVKHLEELGIGRPSTYAPTISTIINRGYIVKEDRPGVKRSYVRLTLRDGKGDRKTFEENYGSEKAKLFPTDIGMLVTDYLSSHFPAILDYGFTANVEEQFDHIADGKLSWQKMITDFYKPFHNGVESAGSEEGGYASSKQRLLGVDPKSGKNVYARVGRFGPMVQIGENDDEDKPRYASLRTDQLTSTITLDEALRLFELPRTAGQYEGKDVVIGVGRFGPYVRFDGKFVSLGKADNPYAITLERAVELIEDKRRQEREKLIRSFDEDGGKTQILNGRYGPYICRDKVNYKIPKGTDPATLTWEKVEELIKSQPASERPKRSFRKR